LRAKKRSLDEATGEEGAPSSVLPKPNTPAVAAYGCSEPTGECPPPPGFPRTPQPCASGHNDDITAWEAARESLQGAVAAPQERAFAANRSSDVVASCFVAILQVCQQMQCRRMSGVRSTTLFVSRPRTTPHTP
jgi:hypothetical protein